jgi:hypothetical protein
MDPGYQPVHVFDGVPFIISHTMSKEPEKIIYIKMKCMISINWGKWVFLASSRTPKTP